MPDIKYVDLTCVNTIRAQSIDAVQAAESGRAGTLMTLASVPLRETPAEPNCDSQQPVDAGSWQQPKHSAVSLGLEKAIMHQIVLRTGARIKMLEVAIMDNVVIIRGYAPSYYVKQLALQGVFDVLGPLRSSRVELNVCVPDPKMSVVNS